MDESKLQLIQSEVQQVIIDMFRDIDDYPKLEKYAKEVAMGMVTALKTGDEILLDEARAQAMILLETGEIIVSRERARMVESVLFAVFHILMKVMK